MKNIIILITTILLSINMVNAEEKKTLANTFGGSKCVAEHKISPGAIACTIKNGFRKLYTKKDGSLNALGKFFNAKALTDLKK